MGQPKKKNTSSGLDLDFGKSFTSSQAQGEEDESLDSGLAYDEGSLEISLGDLDKDGSYSQEIQKATERQTSKLKLSGLKETRETKEEEGSLEISVKDLDRDGSYTQEIKRNTEKQTSKLKLARQKKKEKEEENNTLAYQEGTLEISVKDLDKDGSYTQEIKRSSIQTSKIQLARKKRKEKSENSEVDKIKTEGLGLDKTGDFSTGAIAKFSKGQSDKSHENSVKQQENLAIVKEFEAFKNNLQKEPFFNAKANSYPRIMGDYFVYDHMADGGMAKICRGKYLGDHQIDAKDNLLVIKMIKEEFSKKEDYIEMFMDEIDVAFNFKHPNISAMYDYGKSKDNLFVSMEYIHGKDLMDIINDLKKVKKCLPVPIAVYIAIKMCEGLHYVHNFRDPNTGEELHIVHRDISPHNVMVSFKGEVKVIDFGIAKSDSGKQKDEEGTVKGKINYFAPEYLDGQEIDHRYDQFAVALTLWEMMTGRRTFDEKEQILTLKAILDCNPDKPSKHNKNVNEKLDEIVMKALAKDPKDRFQDMKVFARVMEDFLKVAYPKFRPSKDLGSIIQAMYKSRYQRDVGLFKNWATIALDGVKEKLRQVKSFVARINAFKESNTGSDHRKEMVFDFGFEEEVVSVLNKSKFAKGLQLDLNSSSQRRKDRDKAARKKQLAIAAMMKGADGKTSTRIRTRSQDQRKEKTAPPQPSFSMFKLVSTAAVLTVIYFGYKLVRQASPEQLAQLEYESESNIDIHQAYRNATEFRLLKGIGYIDYEKIVGRSEGTELGFIKYSYEKFMVKFIKPTFGISIDPEIYISERERKLMEMEEAEESSAETKNMEEMQANRDYLDQLVEKKKGLRKPSNEE